MRQPWREESKWRAGRRLVPGPGAGARGAAGPRGWSSSSSAAWSAAQVPLGLPCLAGAARALFWEESLSRGAARYSAERRRGLPSSSRLRGGDLGLLPESLRRSQEGRPGLGDPFRGCVLPLGPPSLRFTRRRCEDRFALSFLTAPREMGAVPTPWSRED